MSCPEVCSLTFIKLASIVRPVCNAMSSSAVTLVIPVQERLYGQRVLVISQTFR